MPAMPSGNIEDRMTSALSSALTSDPEPSQAESVAEAPADAGENAAEIDAQPEAETSEEQPVATEQAEGEQEPDPYADETDADPQVIDQFLKTPRGREIHQGYKFYKELTKPTADGGIGHAPTVQDIRQYFHSHRGAVQMYADYHSGDPSRMAGFFAHWFGPNPQTGQMTPAAANALAGLEPSLAQFGPDAYGAVAQPVMARYETALMDKWRSTQDPNLKQAIYQAVQIIHRDMHDEWLPETAFSGAGKPGQQAQSGVPNAERQRLAAEWDRLNQARAQQQRATWDQWQGKFVDAENNAFSTELDKALKQLAPMKEKTPEIYAATRDRFAQQVRQALMQDQQVWGLYQQQVDQARRSGDPGIIGQVVQRFTNLVVPAIAARRAEFLKGAGVVLKQQNQDKHAQLRQIASHAAPSNSGAPAKRVGTQGNNLKLPGETREQYYERRMRQASVA